MSNVVKNFDLTTSLSST